MTFTILYLVFIIGFVKTFEDVHHMTSLDEFILCRSCGSDVSSSESIIAKSSTRSHYSFNDTLFSKDVLVQVFATDVFFRYPVISFRLSTCVPTGEWEESTSWFPGYRWKPCVCPDCGAYVGFVFEPVNPGLVKPSKTFYGLILTTLISETSFIVIMSPEFSLFWSVDVVLLGIVYFQIHLVLNTLTVYPEGTTN